MQEMIEKGIRPPGINWWGFEETVVAINQKQPGQIAVFLEPYGVDAELALLKELPVQVRLPSVSVDREYLAFQLVELIKARADAMFIRDNALVDFTTGLFGEDTSRPVVLVRGLAHRHMGKLFDPCSVDISSVEDSYALDPIDEAASRCRIFNLSDDALKEYALNAIKSVDPRTTLFRPVLCF